MRRGRAFLLTLASSFAATELCFPAVSPQPPFQEKAALYLAGPEIGSHSNFLGTPGNTHESGRKDERNPTARGLRVAERSTLTASVDYVFSIGVHPSFRALTLSVLHWFHL